MKEGWVCDKLSNCIKLKSGDGLTAKKMIAGDFPVFGGNGIAGYHNAYNLEGKNIIIGRVGAQCGNARFTDEKIWLTDNAFKISEFKYDFNFQFLNYLLNHVDLRSYARQAAQPVISNSSLKNVELCFPTSVEEQKQIVALLDKAFAAIDQAQANIEKNIENAKELFQSKLNEIFSQKGDGWEEKSLGEIIDITHGYAFKSKDFKTDFKGGKPIVLTPGNFDEDSTLYFTQKNTKRLIGEYQKEYLFDIGDLAVVMTDLSSKMKILGKPAIIDSDNILHNQRIGRVVFKKDGIETEFLYYYFQTEKYLNNIKESATGTMVKHTAPKRIVKNQISYPKSIGMQKKMIETINNLKSETEAIEYHYQQKLNNLDDLKKSILQKAFSGELTQKSIVTSI